MAAKSPKPSKGHPKREVLTAFLAGELSEADQEAVARHIEKCDACCQMLREIPEDPFVAKVREATAPEGQEVPANWTRERRREQPLPKELSEHPRYRIGRFLGAGGMGAVYQAEHRVMDRVVAIKIIHRDLIRNPRVIDRFRQEVKAAARLSHPNIVTAYDAEQAGDVHFLVMEYVDGISLGHLVARKGPLDIAMACNFIRQAAKGLQHAFEAGMVHRDIKPHNLMLTRKGQVKILDFGLARLASEAQVDESLPAGPDRPEQTRMGDVMGTPSYIAPEHIADPSQADIRADIYGLGCTLFFLLTGESPPAKDAAPPPSKTRQYRPPRPITDLRNDLPDGLVAVLNKMLATDPAARFATPADVVKAIDPYTKPATAAAPAAKKKPPSPPPVEPPRAEAPGFAVQCPFCNGRTRVPTKSLGTSITCPRCKSFFTAVSDVT
ncbi:MAG: protein kinase [Planctomycetes bacterium]|nr:protein kinase [Planctomycetota bacterium]